MSSHSPAQPRPLPSLVLLVEDNAIIAMNTEALLLDMGIADVRVAGSVNEALTLIDGETFELALLDMKLRDGEDSLPIAERLRVEQVPIIFATGLGEDAGLDDVYRDAPVLRKPYSYDDLQRMIVGL